MDPIYFSIGTFVFFIALFKRELLIQWGNFRIVLGLVSVLFLAGLVLHFTEAGRYSASDALLAPLLSLGLFRLCRRVFLARYGREPKDTSFDWSSGLAADRVFNIVYLTAAMWLVALTAIGMEELAKAGW